MGEWMHQRKNNIKRKKLLGICSLLFLVSCNQSPESIKKQNVKGEYIYRLSSSHVFTPLSPEPKTKESYPWQERFQGKFPRITKEFFRCKGNPLNPVIAEKKEGKKETIYFRDCGGLERHGLPLKDGKEFIYPRLIEILNYLQEKTGKKVVITSGHRCREHNTYCDSSSSNFGSKHMIGAEVDFYVEGMQNKPETIISLIQEFYKEDKGYEKFERYQKEKNPLTYLPWVNKEIFIKLYLAGEGRDGDNQHPYPYVSIQIRFDRELNKPVTFDDKTAKNYLRY